MHMRTPDAIAANVGPVHFQTQQGLTAERVDNMSSNAYPKSYLYLTPYSKKKKIPLI